MTIMDLLKTKYLAIIGEIMLIVSIIIIIIIIVNIIVTIVIVIIIIINGNDAQGWQNLLMIRGYNH